MNWCTRLIRSSIGAKLVMALTGVLLLGFVVGHLLGNLQMFAGQDKFNEYAALLQGLGPGLWAVRSGLLVIFVLHVVTAFRLTRENKAARPKAYRIEQTDRATRASRSMLVTGLIILAYLVYHLAHLTLGWIYPTYHGLEDSLGRHDVYSMTVLGFQVWWITLTYAVAIVALGLHLGHGISSFFQTLGWNHPRYNDLITRLGPALAVLIVAGYLSIPLAVLAGVIQLPQGMVR